MRPSRGGQGARDCGWSTGPPGSGTRGGAAALLLAAASRRRAPPARAAALARDGPTPSCCARPTRWPGYRPPSRRRSARGGPPRCPMGATLRGAAVAGGATAPPGACQGLLPAAHRNADWKLRSPAGGEKHAPHLPPKSNATDDARTPMADVPHDCDVHGGPAVLLAEPAGDLRCGRLRRRGQAPVELTTPMSTSRDRWPGRDDFRKLFTGRRHPQLLLEGPGSVNRVPGRERGCDGFARRQGPGGDRRMGCTRSASTGIKGVDDLIVEAATATSVAGVTKEMSTPIGWHRPVRQSGITRPVRCNSSASR